VTGAVATGEILAMSKDIFVSALENEIKHWPYVDIEYSRHRKHRKANLLYRGKRGSITFPSTSSDNVRGHKNTITELRKLLEGMGAVRVDRAPVSKREHEEVERMATANEVKFGIGPNIITMIVPAGHELFDKFSANGKGKDHWKIETRSNPDLKDDPFIAIVRVKLPPGKKRVNGVYTPVIDRSTNSVELRIKTQNYPRVAAIGEFRMSPVRVREVHANEVVIEMPKRKDRKEYLLRGDARLERLTRPEPIQEEVVSTVEESRAIEPASEPGLERFADLIKATVPAAPKFPDKLQLSLPERPLTVERCVEYLNRKKQSKGNNLRFTIDPHSGLISYIEKGGPAH
jgi:hypothetical protein